MQCPFCYVDTTKRTCSSCGTVIPRHGDMPDKRRKYVRKSIIRSTLRSRKPN